ncbi:MAG TPA: hypothetical protein VFX96_14990 [Pyrinomonadaceae bacterium]|nr:hypothetical protein [Pyrinomonadaceae bacterium]
MSHITDRRFAIPFCLLLVSALLLSAPASAAQAADKEDEPAYKEYKGVRIGMTADEARKKLGDPTDKGDKQDFYAVNDNETVQVYYDSDKKVFALSVLYMGAAAASAPTCKSVLGAEVEAGDDGRVHKMVQYPKAGYWVSYSRTGGDTPIVTITMQKK